MNERSEHIFWGDDVKTAKWRAVFVDPTNPSSGEGVFEFELPYGIDPLDETFRRAPKGFEFMSVGPVLDEREE